MRFHGLGAHMGTLGCHEAHVGEVTVSLRPNYERFLVPLGGIWESLGHHGGTLGVTSWILLVRFVRKFPTRAL